MTNKLNWKNIDTKDDRVLYLQIMKDLRAYAAKGYIDVEMSMMNLMVYPASLARRIWQEEVGEEDNNLILTLDWEKPHEVSSCLHIYISLLCKINHVFLNIDAFDDAYDEFIKYLKTLKKDD